MRTALLTLAVIGVACSLSGPPANEPAEAAPIIVADPAVAAERDALKAEVESLRAELKQALSRPASEPAPVATVQQPPADAASAAFYQYRPIYGGFRGRRIVGREMVLVTGQQAAANGACATGTCSRSGRRIFGGRR